MAHTATSYTLGRAAEATLVAQMETLSDARFITAFGSVLAALPIWRPAHRLRHALFGRYDVARQAAPRKMRPRSSVRVICQRSQYLRRDQRARLYASGVRSITRRGRDLSLRRRYADARCVAAAGGRHRQAGDLGGIGDDVACLAHRGRPLPHQGLRPIARRRLGLSFRAPEYCPIRHKTPVGSTRHEGLDLHRFQLSHVPVSVKAHFIGTLAAPCDNNWPVARARPRGLRLETENFH